MNLRPLDRLSGIVGFPEFLNVGAVCLDDQMAIHASRKGGNIGVRTALDLIVTVLALDIILAHVELVAKGQWLFWRITLVVTPTILKIATG